ncbi:MAG: bifunctional UDP-sugar hydrolase/5'-nucleotidase [Salinivirgaceae bacterium]|nr:bifunctional UDP-sugar hydrolase/5'-nucleotidase [Salinivirgaceae bacterium]MDD4747920.1 bifunctional UDP-sugar hydrolase/5'-nucleotidase [Salinivirgaceae bacterium]
MKLYIDDEEISIYNGAKVLDVVRAYFAQRNEKLPNKLPVVTDAYGNSVELNGELSEGNHLYINIRNKGNLKTIVTTPKVIHIIALLGISLLMGCNTNQKGKETEQSEIKTIEILAVNDMHAALDNFPRFAFMVDSLRSIYPDLLLVSGGDNQTGNPANDQYSEKGMPIIELMNAIKFDLSAVGNHEFDSRLTGFEDISHKAEFDFISANMVLPKEANFKIKPYKIVRTPNNLQIAFVSLLNINKNGIPDSHPDNVIGFAFKDPFKTAQDYLFLKDSCDVFIMLNHMGFEEDVKIAMQMAAESVDLIIGGHSHTKIEKDQIHNGIMITQAGSRLYYATLIRLTVTPEGKLNREMQLLTVGKEGNRRADIQEMVDAYNINPALTEIIAIAEDDFLTSEEVGYLMTDAIRVVSGTDLAFINPGGVRVSKLAKGPVRTRDVYEMDPFGNEVVRINLTGHEIRNLLLSAYNFGDYSSLYPSGMTTRYLFNPDGSLNKVELLTTNGKPFVMDKTYSVVLNHYMAAVYKYDHKDPGQSLFRTSAEVTIDYLKTLKTIPSYRGVKRVKMVR